MGKYGKIYLYGEHHSKDDILEEELRCWKKYYDEQGMRHLFIESCYFSGQILNRWMKSDDDTLFNKMFEDLRGTLAYHHSFLDFYRYIKKNCPETVFHATDVGHQYKSTGKWYLELLKHEGKQDTEEYRLTEESIEQGRRFRNDGDPDGEYREACMISNFIREYEGLGCIPIMGIYGSWHTKPGGLQENGKPRMGNAITQRYEGAVELTDLSVKFDYNDREYGKIHLFGEHHSKKDIMEEELRQWKRYYHEEGWRDLFIEMPYYTGQLLNRWMKDEGDEVLKVMFENLKGTAADSPDTVEFYREIKRSCPETVFHATDVGHQFDTTGAYYLDLLKKEGKENTREYMLTEEAISQGKRYRGVRGKDHAYREAAMGLNFVRAYEAIGCKPIMGIYGSFHTRKGARLENGELIMVSALQKRFGKTVEVTDLSVQFGYSKKPGKIHLCGEYHANEVCLKEELRLWKKYYHEEGMRHLFIEVPYYTGQILNRWMKAEDDELLLFEHKNSAGTAGHADCTLEFYREIKKTCPETVFHATDVGHQYATTGKWYRELLIKEGKEGTEEFKLTEEAIDQGTTFRAISKSPIHEYREYKMTQNFIREYEKLGGIPVMGIYGGWHTKVGATLDNGFPRMSTALRWRYADAVEVTDLYKKLVENKK